MGVPFDAGADIDVFLYVSGATTVLFFFISISFDADAFLLSIVDKAQKKGRQVFSSHKMIAFTGCSKIENSFLIKSLSVKLVSPDCKYEF